jgi:hypothetical protein
MLTGVKARIIKAFVGSIAKSNDTRTTIMGIVAAALIAAQLDWTALLKGDPDQIGMAAGAVVAALWGYWTNKPDGEAETKQAKR